jgi:cyclopropane fatty-acyl-phospholipid synthase-like methyltransferase
VDDEKTIAHARWTADLLDVQPDDNVLEVGFGNGANIELLAQRASKGCVAGAEISETAIEMASKRNARAISEGRVKLHQAAGGSAAV